MLREGHFLLTQAISTKNESGNEKFREDVRNTWVGWGEDVGVS